MIQHCFYFNLVNYLTEFLQNWKKNKKAVISKFNNKYQINTIPIIKFMKVKQQKKNLNWQFTLKAVKTYTTNMCKLLSD